jgi:hypothetical protein
MGRYAFFNTGFEYKFWFGIQPSEDILCFAGEDKGDYHHEWSSDDVEYIKAKLLVLARDYGVKVPDFENYDITIDGTDEMYQEIPENAFPDEKKAALFCLGCIIYHQLTYVEVLKAHYEP